jgi:hypothetical protein
LTLFKTGTYTGDMKYRRLPAAVLAFVFLAAAPSLARAQATRRTVFVSALDKSGAPVANLTPSDVTIREDNAAREVLTVSPADDPMQIAILVDDSTAAEPFIGDYRNALPGFIEALTAGDQPGQRNEVALFTLGGRPTLVTDYTFDRALLQKGVLRIFSQSESGTYLLDGIIEISKGLMKKGSGRQVIVAITTEGPELSERIHTQVTEPLKASGAALYVVVVGRPENHELDRSVVIMDGSRATGGQYINLLSGTALPARLKQLAEELTHQFRVTYAAPQSLIPPDRLTIASAKEGITVRGTSAVPEGGQERR